MPSEYPRGVSDKRKRAVIHPSRSQPHRAQERYMHGGISMKKLRALYKNSTSI